MIVDLGSASNFIDFSESELTLSLDDLSDSGIDSGFYEITFKLIDDRDNEVEEIVIIDVRDPDPDEVIIASSIEEDDTTEVSEDSENAETGDAESSDTFDWRQAFIDLENKRKSNSGQDEE